MSTRPKISVLLLAILLAFGSAGKASTIYGTRFEQAKEKTTLHQADNPNLFAIHHQEKTGVNLLDRFPKSNSAEHSEDNIVGCRPAQASLHKQQAIYLRFCKTIDCSVAIKKIIFPFHSHW